MVIKTNLSPELINVYRVADFQVQANPTFILNVDLKSEGLKTLFKDSRVNSAAYITAWNPYGELLSKEENQARNKLLKNELNLRSLKFIDGFGQDPMGQWAGEDSFLVLGISLEASKKLGAQFEQNAIVWSDKDALPKLIHLR